MQWWIMQEINYLYLHIDKIGLFFKHQTENIFSVQFVEG